MGTAYSSTLMLHVRGCLAAWENPVGAAAAHAPPPRRSGTEHPAAAGPRSRGPRLSYTVIQSR